MLSLGCQKMPTSQKLKVVTIILILGLLSSISWDSYDCCVAVILVSHSVRLEDWMFLFSPAILGDHIAV